MEREETYKKALESIKNTKGKVCPKYEICDHEACKSSYESWAIADAALTECSNISSSYSRSETHPIGDPETTYPLFKFISIILLIICLLLAILAISEIQYNKKWINKNSERIEKLEKVNYVEYVEFDTLKKLTSDEFERTWRSFGIIRNNFLAFGTGFHLGEKDVYDDEDDQQNQQN